MTIIYKLLRFVAGEDLKVQKIDVKIIFLNRYLKKEIYIE